MRAISRVAVAVAVVLALVVVAAVWPFAAAPGTAAGARAGPERAVATGAASGARRKAQTENPCLDRRKRARLLCPDLVMTKPYGLQVDPLVRPGRIVLRAGNSIDSVGLGPAELHGVRTRSTLMRARQRIYRRAGGRIGIDTGARLYFKFIPGQGRYWKFLDAARFELWRLDSRGRTTRRVRQGPKVSYCLRDLRHTQPGRPRSPVRFVYPGCNRSAATRRVTLGTSVGWSDVYPPTYPEQWIDVTGLRGCFAYRHVADPLNGIYESNERNNSASVSVRLPFRPGRQRCPGVRPGPEPEPPAPKPPAPEPPAPVVPPGAAPPAAPPTPPPAPPPEPEPPGY